ncbi:MAG: IclR family transcriptional regulator [Burkholderiales bacterium]
MSSDAAAQNRSAMRALEVFEAFRTARRPLPLSELAQRTGIPVSTCHGVMRALETHGWLYYVNARDAYPTRRLWDTADEIRAHDPVVRRLEPALAALRDETDETVVVGARQGGSVTYLLVLEGRQAIRYSARAGERKPLHSSSIGKALLGELAPDTLDAWLREHPLERITANTITSAKRLRADLDAGRRRGWFATCGENVADVMAVSAALRGFGAPLGVAVAGPVHRMQGREAATAKRLLACLRRLEVGEGG